MNTSKPAPTGRRTPAPARTPADGAEKRGPRDWKKTPQKASPAMAFVWIGLAIGACAVLVILLIPRHKEEVSAAASAAAPAAAPVANPGAPPLDIVTPRYFIADNQEPANKAEALQQAAKYCNKASEFGTYLSDHPNLPANEKAGTELAIRQARDAMTRLSLKFDLRYEEIAEAARKAAGTPGTSWAK